MPAQLTKFSRISAFPGRLGTFLFLVAFLFLSSAEATVYQWKDDQGRTHFTDDITTIPQKFRPNSLKLRGMEPTQPPPQLKAPARDEVKAKDETPEEEVEGEGEKEIEKEADKDKEKKKGLSEGVQNAIRDAITFLEQDISRYVPYYESVAKRLVIRQVDGLMKGALPEKKALAKRLAESDLEVLQATASFLEKSIANDEKPITLGPRDRNRWRFVLRRLKEEEGEKRSLIEKLKSVLASDSRTTDQGT